MLNLSEIWIILYKYIFYFFGNWVKVFFFFFKRVVFLEFFKFYEFEIIIFYWIRVGLWFVLINRM